MHLYLDDLIFAGSVDTGQCQKILYTFHNLCEEMGISFYLTRSKGPPHEHVKCSWV